MAAILLIDDDTLVRDMLAATLRGAGHVVRAAATAEEGLALFRSERPELVLTDVILPDGAAAGVELIRAVRDADPDLPILAMSGGADEAARDVLDALEAKGALRQIGKPFRLRMLVELVGATLSAA